MAGFTEKIVALVKDELGEQLQGAIDAANQAKAMWTKFQDWEDRVSKLEKRMSGLEKEEAAWNSRRAELSALRKKVSDMELLMKERGNVRETHPKNEMG